MANPRAESSKSSQSEEAQNARVEEDLVRHYNSVFPEAKMDLPPRQLGDGEEIEKKRQEIFATMRAALDKSEEEKAAELHDRFLKSKNKSRRKAGRKKTNKEYWKNRREKTKLDKQQLRNDKTAADQS